MRSDEELMQAYVEGDTSAFRELFQRYSPLVFRVLRQRIRVEADARDLTQQTFLQLHRARLDFRQGARLRPWLMTIALNLRREYFRRRARRPEDTLELDGYRDPSVEPGTPVEDQQLAGRVRLAVAELPEKQREVIELHWFEGMPFPEVAEVVGAKLSAVKVRAHRGYGKLRTILGSFEGNHSGAADVSAPEGSTR